MHRADLAARNPDARVHHLGALRALRRELPERLISLVERLTASDDAPALLIQLEPEAAALALKPSGVLFVVLVARGGESWNDLIARTAGVLATESADVMEGLLAQVIVISVMGARGLRLADAPPVIPRLRRVAFWFSVGDDGEVEDEPREIADALSGDMRAARRKLRALVVHALHGKAPEGPHLSMAALEEIGERELAAEAQLKRRMSTRPPQVTITLIATCVAVFGLEILFGVAGRAPGLTRMGGNLGRSLFLGHVEVLFAAGLLHAGLLHLFVNMSALYNLGQVLESLVGGARLLFAFTAAVVGGNILAAFVRPDVVGVGASGGIFGLFGLLLGLTIQKDLPALARTRVRQGLVTSLLLNLGISLLPGISFAAHAGGFLVGLLLGATGWLARHVALPWRPAVPPELEARSQRLFTWLAFLSAAAFAMSFSVALLFGRPWAWKP